MNIFRNSIMIVALTIALLAPGITVYAESHEASELPPPQIPPIIKPDYMPGPETYQGQDTGQYSASTQDWFVYAVAKTANGFIGTVAIIAFLMLIIAGIQMLTAYGDEEKITAAKKNIMWAIMGLLLALFAFAIVQIINTLPLTFLEAPPESSSSSP